MQNQRGLDGYELKEALLGVARLLGELAPLLQVNAMQLITGAAELSQIHAKHRQERVRLQSDITPHQIHPTQSEELYRFML